MSAVIREPAVAGRFYPAQPTVLREAVDAFVAGGARPQRADVPKALVVPHAGYVYSGPIAGSAYATLRNARSRVKRVVLLGPAHRVPVTGLARPAADVLGTPLGGLRVDERLDALVPWVPRSGLAHAEEHSLEVQLPFLLRVLGPDVTVAPFVVGDASTAEVARVLDALWGGDETLIVVSSDLSHYLPYDVARSVDTDTADAIVALVEPLDPERACGARAIDGLLAVARQRGLSAHRLDLRSSGDTAGPRGEVVGYGAFAFYEPQVRARAGDEPTKEDDSPRGPRLLALARAAAEEALGVPGAHVRAAATDAEPWLRAPGATFVTLHRRDGELHGCIGSLEAHRPLGADVRANAMAAATLDPRATDVRPEAAKGLVVEVSELSPLERIRVPSREALLRELRPGEDGVVLSWHGRRGTFLPQVWESLPDPDDFLSHLERKAGLPQGFWSPDLDVFRYHVRKYTEA